MAIKISRVAKVTTDHHEIRKWAESRCGRQAVVKGTDILRIDFPGYRGMRTLQEITWDEFFKKFEEKNLALVYEEKTAAGNRSNFNKLVKRETVEQLLRKRKTEMKKTEQKKPERRLGRKAA